MDRYDEMAKIAGEAAGLRSEQFAGLAHIMRALVRDEREACAKIADAWASSALAVSASRHAASSIAAQIRDKR